MDKKNEGNQYFVNKRHSDAIDTFMQGLCGMTFDRKKLSKDKISDIDHQLKVPMLNNLSLCFF